MSEANTRYAAEYSHNGRKWALDIFVESPEDALAKIESVKASVVLLGAFEPNVKLRGAPLLARPARTQCYALSGKC